MEDKRFAVRQPNNRLPQGQIHDHPVFDHIRLSHHIRDRTAGDSGLIRDLDQVFAKPSLDISPRGFIMDMEGHQGRAGGQDAARLVFRIDMVDLLDILNADDKFRAQAAAKIDSVDDVLQVRQQEELINDKPDIALAALAAKGFLDRQINQQTVNRGQKAAHAQIVFDEHGFPLFLTHKLADGQGSGAREVADEQLAGDLLQLGHDALGLERSVVSDISGHRQEIRISGQQFADMRRAGIKDQIADRLVVRRHFLTAANHEQRRKQILGGTGEERILGRLDPLIKERFGYLNNVGVLLVVLADLAEYIPIIVLRFALGLPAGFLVIADDDIAGQNKVLDKIPFGVKDDHRVVRIHLVPQLTDDLIEGIGFAGSDAAQQEHVPAQKVLVKRQGRVSGHKK